MAHPDLDPIAEFAHDYVVPIHLLFMVVPLVCLYAYGTLRMYSMKKAIILLLILILTFLALYLIHYVTMDMIKETVLRPRPYLDSELDARIISPLSAAHDYRSFPSRAASSSFFMFSVIIYLLHKSSESMKLPKYLIPVVIICGFALALLRAYSRAYLGHHYPSDIVSGAIFGLLFSFVSVMVIERVGARRILHLLS